MLQKKRRDYLAYIGLVGKLNAEQEKANRELARSKPYISPQPQAYTSAKQALEDTGKQKEIALSHLREILPFGSEALDALFKLGPEVGLFNRHWGSFKDDIKGQAGTPLTPANFLQLWRRFMVKLGSTRNTGIPIALTNTNLVQNVHRLAHEINQELRLQGAYTRQELVDIHGRINTMVLERDIDGLAALRVIVSRR